jgi:hypothetical protein
MDIAVDPRRRHAHFPNVVFGGFFGTASPPNVQPMDRERKGLAAKNRSAQPLVSGPFTVIDRAPAKQSFLFVAAWIASSRSLSSGAHSRDPLAPRNDRVCKYTSAISRRDASEVCEKTSALKTEGVGNAGCPMHPQPRVRYG